MKNLLSAILLITMFSCEKPAPAAVNEEELITTLTYNLKAADGSLAELQFRDLDGDGGNPPVITAGNLKANTSYDGILTLLNETASPIQNISDEVKTEATDHQFFFRQTQLNLTIAYVDSDNNGKPLGLKTKVVTGAASTGKLQITLKHKPNKSGMNVSTGDIANAGGETDIQVEFDIVIK